MVKSENIKNCFILVLLIGFTLPLKAQDVSFVASAPETIEVGDQFRITYEINDRVKDFKPPQFNDFVFLSSQQGVSTINWKTTQQFVFFFKATQEGTFNVDPATARHKGDQIESNSLTIKVVGKSSQGQSASQSKSQKSPGTDAKTVGGEDVFVRLILNKNSAFVGEQITGYIKVYTKLSLSGIDNAFQGPDFTGFYVQNVATPPLKSLEPEKVGEETYYSGIIRKVILIPQRSGELKIKPFEVTVQHDKKVKIGYFTTYQPQNVSLTSKAKTVRVKPLPANKPAGFAGAIGDFSIKAKMNSDEIKTNDAVVFNVTLSGTGNIKLIDKVHYEFPPTFDAFDPVVKTKLSESGYSGSKTFEITVIPRHAGEYNIQPFKLVYFDPKLSKYITKKTKNFVLNVLKTAGDTSGYVVSNNLSQAEVELLESDIRYLKTDTKLVSTKDYIIDSIVYYLLIVLSILLLITYLVVKREQIKRNADLARTKHRKASKLANKRLKLAKKLLAQSQMEEFYEELSRALWGYISDKLNIQQSELSIDLAKSKLLDLEIDENSVSALLDIISTCEFARYASGGVDKKGEDLIKESDRLLSLIDQKI